MTTTARSSSNVVDALAAYEVKPVLWSHREQAAEELAAHWRETGYDPRRKDEA